MNRELRAQGYAVAVCWTVDEANKAIESYLDEKSPEGQEET